MGPLSRNFEVLLRLPERNFQRLLKPLLRKLLRFLVVRKIEKFRGFFETSRGKFAETFETFVEKTFKTSGSEKVFKTFLRFQLKIPSKQF